MESIDDIYEADDEVQVEEEQSAPELLKDIIGSLRDLSGKIADGSIEDLATLTSDLKTISSSLKELVGSDEVDEDSDWSNDYESDVGEDDLEEGHGAEGMGPTFDANGTQNYENDEGSSYPEKKGFVGI